MNRDKLRFKEAKRNFLKQPPLKTGTLNSIETAKHDKNGQSVFPTIGQMVGETGHKWMINFLKNLEPITKED